MLTGSRSDVAPGRYGGDPDPAPLDEARDEVALGLSVQRHPEWTSHTRPPAAPSST
jgi:hypothetical protein